MYKPKSRETDVVAEEVSGDCVLYDDAAKRAHHLNSTLFWIWKRCDGSRSIDALAMAMQQELGYDNAVDIVASGLEQLALANLLEPGFVDPYLLGADSSSVNRRLLIKSRSIVAPVITSVLASTPAAAKAKPDTVDKVNGSKLKSGKTKN